jgi:hypothetical protein
MSQATANQKPSTAIAETGRPMAVGFGDLLGIANMKSETPRTDAAVFKPNHGYEPCVAAEFAQQLERELRDAKQQMVGLRREIEHQKARAAAMPNSISVEVSRSYSY